METIIVIFSLLVLLVSVAIHELAHGYVAYSLGDFTAKYAGRLTLNPLKHLDFFGSILLPIFLLIATGGQGPIFGWAKPVPINPYNFKDQKWGTVKVAVAGPSANFAIAIIFGLLIRFIYSFHIFALSPLIYLLSIVVIYNFLWGIFNLLPIPPLDGSWLLFKFLPFRLKGVESFFQEYGIFILILFVFFGGLNLLGFFSELLYYWITGVGSGFF